MEKRQFEVEFSLKNNSARMYERVIANNSSMAWNVIKARHDDNLYRIHKATEIKETSKVGGNQTSSSSSGDSGNTTYIIGIVGAILYGLWILLSNIINMGLISKYDFDLYLSNITHFNSGFEGKATSIDATIDLTYPDEYIGKKYQISKNKIVFYNGYKNSKTARLTAVSLYDNEIKIYGYIRHAKNIKSLKTINPEIISKIKATIASDCKKDIESKVKLYQAKTKKQIEDYENKNYTKIPQISNEEITYFYSDENADLVKKIESKYYDDEIYEKEFSSLGNEYYKSIK